ncbi:MAG: succinylglutamate-semialdehyde dehydrogenase [Legionellales bacterium]|jgi:succinylglutamic semialdehyde dehydrogenase
MNAVNAAKQAFLEWSLTSLDTRIDYLKKMQQLIKENIQVIAESISLETGKVLWECVMEAQSMVNKIDISIEAYGQRTGESSKNIDHYQLHIRHKPIGVLAVFVPFNFPGHLLNTHVVPAILAGNTVVIKPSELTPKTAELIVALWQKTGLPKGVINLVQGAGDVGRELASQPDLNGICFTGSFKVGQQLHQQMAGQTDKLLVLEMGGNNPLIVADILDIDNAVLTIILSSYITAGQRCTCTRRLIIIENYQTEILLQKLIEKLKHLRVNYPKTNPEPFMGPVISAQAGQHVLDKQKDLQTLGGKSLLETKALDPNNTALLSPGLIDMTGIDAPDEEIFGPLLQVFRVKDLTQAIKLANKTQYGLTAGILTTDIRQYETFFNHSRAGTVNWNRPTTGISGIAPFGGLGHSGNFRPTGFYAADYCAYPVISLQSTALKHSAPLPPGLD